MNPWLILFALACSTPEPVMITEMEQQVISAPIPELTEPTEARYAASHILIAYSGAAKAPSHIGRSKEEAQQLATELLARHHGGEPFRALAKEHSDGGSGPRGGVIGTYRTGTMAPPFEAAVAALKPGEVSKVVETPFGFHLIRRDPVVEYRAQHIVVSWKGAHNSKSSRPKARARAMIESTLGQLSTGVAFEDVAREVSEDATAASGGNLGIIARGQFIPEFEETLAALEPGETSGVIETPYGFHVIKRLAISP
jgi:peptidyl-prolyl cis-trans isomerase SurA